MAKPKQSAPKKLPQSTRPPAPPIRTPTLEQKVKEWSKVSAKIDAANRVVKLLTAEYDAMEREIYDLLKAQGLTTIGTGTAVAFIQTRTFTKFDEENGFELMMEYVYKNKATDLLHRRVNMKAYLDRIQQGEKIKGITTVEVPSVHLKRR